MCIFNIFRYIQRFYPSLLESKSRVCVGRYPLRRHTRRQISETFQVFLHVEHFTFHSSGQIGCNWKGRSFSAAAYLQENMSGI